MSTYEYIIKMKDYASSSLRKIAASAGVTDKRIAGVDRRTNALSGSLLGLKRIIVTAFATASIGLFINKTIDARSEYERFQAVLTNTFQSAAVGEGALNMITDFAAKTPFQVNELTDSFVKLVNRGFNPTYNELTKIGDLASSQGKSFGQLTEAILDAETNEFERLKEFGIKASKAGDQVSFSFKGITKTVRNNADEIRAAILEYGGMPGVAKSMEAISKTLGGRISNLKDRWWSFLVAVGGQSNTVFTSFIDTMSAGLGFLTDHLPQISNYFKILWSYIEPVGASLFSFFRAMFGFTDASSVLSGFGNTMLWILGAVDVFTTGLVTIINWLTPFADYIGIATGAWWLFNAAMYASPMTWIVIGIVAVIAAIGFLQKYTSGWADSWQRVVNGLKLLWESYTNYVKLGWTAVVQGLMIGLDKIKLGWYQFKEAVGIGNSSENQKIIADISAGIDARKEAIKSGYKAMVDTAKQAGDEFAKMGITVDKKAMANDYLSLKNKFSGLGQKSEGSTAYDNYLNQKKAAELAKSSGKTKPDSIVSGGSKQTNITVTIQKLQDDTKIYVSSAEKGINEMGDKIQEMILRAVNSVNQMQTN